MGNIVTSNYNLPGNSFLSELINKWAINDYDAGVNYKKTYTIKNLLKKRACCTKTKKQIIAFPDIQLNKPYDQQISNIYYPVNIKVFQDLDRLEDSTKNYCIFKNELLKDDADYSFFQNPISKTSIGAANASCSTIYEGGGGNLDLCGLIKNERDMQHPSDLSKQSYGFYSINPNTLNSLNNYTDCNCRNSMLKQFPVEIIENAPNVSDLGEMMAQSNDRYCSECARAGSCYIPANHTVESLCINIAKITDVVAENNSNVVNNQSCNMGGNSAKVDMGDKLPSYVPPSPSSPSSPTTPPSSSNTTTYILIGIAILIVIILILIGLKLFKII